METSSTVPSRVNLNTAGVTFVEPASPVQSRTEQCSAVDNLCAEVYHTIALFFKLEAGSSPLRQYNYLRRGLSQALLYDDIWTGYLEKDNRGAYSTIIHPAPHAGTQFYYCDLSRDRSFPTFDYLKRNGFPYSDGATDGLGQLQPAQFPTHEAGQPMMIAQFTHINGGAVLTVSMTHLVTDVIRISRFMKYWAKVTKGLSEGGPLITETTPYELVDSTRLKPAIRPYASWEELRERSKQFTAFRLIEPTMTQEIVLPFAHLPSCPADTERHLRTTIVGVWNVTRADTDFIAKAASAGKSRLSYMDALVAFVWSRFFLAKYPDPKTRPDHSTIVNAINVRGRLNPPMPAQYLGACVDLTRATMPAEALCSAETKAPEGNAYLTRIADGIRLSNTHWSEEAYFELLNITQQTPTSPGFILRGPVDFLCTDHRGFAQVLESNWGPVLGAPAAYRQPYIGRDMPMGEVEMMPGPDRSINVQIAAERIVLQRLSADPEFSRMSTRLYVEHDVIEEYFRSVRETARL